MKLWLVYSLLTVVFWGCMGFFGKLASRSVSTQSLPVLASLGGLIVFPVFLLICSRQMKFEWANVNYYQALLAGIIGTIGTLLFYMAIARGEASKVVPFTATYPLVTLLLSLLFLGESLSIQKVVGVALAILGICLLSIK